MLPKKRRIERKEFEYILKTGRRYNSPHLLLYMAENTAKPSRFSFSVSKKIYKHAVDRNRYRRRGYSVLRPLLSRISPGFLFFFSFKKGHYPLTFADLQTEVSHLLTSALVLS